jgi:hypothetical protein
MIEGVLGLIMFQLMEKGNDKDDSALTLEHPEHWSDKAKNFLPRTSLLRQRISHPAQENK